jgi:hypothetical protein
MSDWNDQPPSPAEFAGVRLIRVPKGTVLQGIITCDRMVGRFTHFVRRRTVPHVEKDCPECLNGSEPRWHGYISVWAPTGHAHSVLELTALAAAPVQDFQDRHGSLRGAEIYARRLGNAPNGPVQTTVNAADHDLRKIPQAVNLRAFLCTIWRIPLDNEPSPPPANRMSKLLDPATAPGNGEAP